MLKCIFRQYWIAIIPVAIWMAAQGTLSRIDPEPCLFNSPESCEPPEASFIFTDPADDLNSVARMIDAVPLVVPTLASLLLLALAIALNTDHAARTSQEALRFPKGPLRSKRRPPWDFPKGSLPSQSPDAADPAKQMEAISRVDFETQPLLNRDEAPLLRLLEVVARELDAEIRVMAQTSMGEILRPKPGSGNHVQCDLAFRSINSKRLDFAVFNRFGRVILAVENQGSGHYHRTSFMRDAGKAEVLRKAGVPLVQVHQDYDAREIAELVHRTLLDHLGRTRQKPAQVAREGSSAAEHRERIAGRGAAARTG